MLKLEHVSKRYTDFSLSDVSFELPEGMIMGLIGENGAGKTTCLSAILSTIHHEGKVYLFGKDKENLTFEERQDVGVVFDENSYSDFLTIKDIEKISKALYKKWDHDLFANLCRQHNLSSDKKIKEFSKGMKMKLNIFTALAHHPKLLILDEATSGLDPVARDELLDVFYEFVSDGKHSILMSSHILSDIEKIADMVTFISSGQVLLSESKDDLLAKYVLVRCSEDEVKNFRSDDILGMRKYAYGVEVCVAKSAAANMNSDPVTLDDVMVFAARSRKEKR